jgi:asparagine synthase (glutamine-hydrolysing)
MCNILVVVNKGGSVDVERCKQAMRASHLRGCDWSYYSIESGVFLGCDVLSITGQMHGEAYYKYENYELFYNGEIYNLARPADISDTEALVKEFAESKNVYDVLKKLDGMFGIALYDKSQKQLYLARDIVGEKTIYIYEDSEYYIASSTLGNILAFINNIQIDTNVLSGYLNTRHLLTFNKTIYKNIRQIQPGVCEVLDIPSQTHHQYTFENIYSYISDARYNYKYADLSEELDFLLNKCIREMLSQKRSSISFSGGIDSSLIAWYVASNTSNYTLVGTNCCGKDRISSNLQLFQPYFTNKIHTIDITRDHWVKSIKDTIEIINMPLPSHSFHTRSIYSKYLHDNKIRVSFGGEGADEIFGGYSCYLTRNKEKNMSPYSSFLNIPITHSYDTTMLLTRLTEEWKRAFTKTSSNILSMSYTDTVLQLVDDGLRSADQISGWYGIESRAPFVRKDILKFAFSIPEKYKRGKPLLKELFLKKYANIPLMKKQGFAGFPNDVKELLKPPLKHYNIIDLFDIKHFKYTKQVKWKLLNLELFYESYNSRLRSNTSK